ANARPGNRAELGNRGNTGRLPTASAPPDRALKSHQSRRAGFGKASPSLCYRLDRDGLLRAPARVTSTSTYNCPTRAIKYEDEGGKSIAQRRWGLYPTCWVGFLLDLLCLKSLSMARRGGSRAATITPVARMRRWHWCCTRTRCMAGR